MINYRYDAFGRKVEQKHCQEEERRPSVTIEYHLDRTPGQSYVMTRHLEQYRTDNYTWSKQIVDGLGRMVQTHSQSELGTIATTTSYNSRGLVWRATIPYLVTLGKPDPNRIYLLSDSYLAFH